MPTWPYWHRIEYRRELGDNRREHAYTEVVEDHGWMFCHDPEKQQDWFVHYTTACAEDFLRRVHAKPGTWVVAVWWTGTTPDAKGTLRGSIRLNWQR